MIFLSLRVTADAGGGLKIRAHQRPGLQGIGGGSHQQARAGYIPAHCLPITANSIFIIFQIHEIMPLQYYLQFEPSVFCSEEA